MTLLSLSFAAVWASSALADHTLAHTRDQMNGLQAQQGCRGPVSLLGVASQMPRGVHSLPQNHPVWLAWDDVKTQLQPLYQQRETARRPIAAAEQKWPGLSFVPVRDLLEGVELDQYLAAERQVAALNRQIAPLELQAAAYQEQAQKSCGG